MFVYILNFLDRTIIYIFFPLIKKEMFFSDTQLALLGTTSFVIFYTLLDKSFVLLCLGYELFGLATNNLSIWGATFYSHLHQFDLVTIGFWGGILTLIAGIPATLFGGAIADWFHKGQKANECVTVRCCRSFPFRSGSC